MNCSAMSEFEEIVEESGSESESSDSGLDYHVTFAPAARDMQPMSDSDEEEELEQRPRARSGTEHFFFIFNPASIILLFLSSDF